MSALICGSFAYDNIMVFQDRFKNHVLPDQIHILNVSFLVPQLRREFGGCAGNIAYNLKLLGGSPLPMGTIGEDFLPYQTWMESHNIVTARLREVPGTMTAQAFIITDLDNNQITAFHPGAMNFAEQNHIADAQGVTIGIVSPDGRDGMIVHAREFAEADIPFIFDPGQGMPMFDGEDLRQFIKQASYVTVNDYEWQLLRERTGWSPTDVAAQVQALIITHGGSGSEIYHGAEIISVPSAQPQSIVDPTGCGDAYRAGLLFGIMNQLDWATTGRMASLMGAIKIEVGGTQNHSFSMSEFAARFKEAFGRDL